jgi:hypothetical protein
VLRAICRLRENVHVAGILRDFLEKQGHCFSERGSERGDLGFGRRPSPGSYLLSLRNAENGSWY